MVKKKKCIKCGGKLTILGNDSICTTCGCSFPRKIGRKVKRDAKMETKEDIIP